MSFFLAPRKTNGRWLTMYYIGKTAPNPATREAEFMVHMQALNIRCFYTDELSHNVTDADRYDMVFISETVSSSTVLGTYKNWHKPLIAGEPLILDDMYWNTSDATTATGNTNKILCQAPIIAKAGLTEGDHVVATSGPNRSGANSFVDSFGEPCMSFDSDTNRKMLAVCYPGGELDDGSRMVSLGVYNGFQQGNDLNHIGLHLTKVIWAWIGDWTRSEVYGDRI